MIKFTFEKLPVFFLIIFFYSSCADQKQFIYFQKAANQSDTIKVAEDYVPHIQQGDILSVYVSSLSPEASSFFNPFPGGSISKDGASASPSLGSSSDQTSAQGYLVDVNGNIQLPLIGATYVKGLTTLQVMNDIKDKLKIYLKEPSVNVRFLNYKISITGQVAKPAVYVIPNEMITLPEALTMAGDLTVTGDRNDILIVRDDNGKKVFGHVNLNTREVYNSPYYYLHNNDLVYVKPNKIIAQQADRSFQYLSVGISILSLLLIIFRK